ncbi:MAG TPA: glutamate--cysteine ligase [Acetobacteraceae bacterium]|nr:glutamate--cysteine ligase [Acetobacteraceae bacterium]
MSNPGEEDATPITSVRQLAEYIAVGCKPREDYRTGTEHEKFGFRWPGPHCPPGQEWTSPAYEPDGIRAVLESIAAQGWEPILDAGRLIGLKRGGASISLEPGGQFELSGAPLDTVHETAAELHAHLSTARDAGAALGIGFAPLGFHPLATREQMPWMPKSRYAIMRRYMQRTGRLGLDMMLRTCTVQVNLDYSSEADMVRKLRVGMLLQPVATALFANSPFTEGKPNGLLSARAAVWRDTDPDRTGIPDVVFEDGFGFERYVEWLLDVPMYFITRDGQYIDIAGASFRDWLRGKVPALAGQTPTVGDFADHMTTAFTEVRLKRYLEMRGADAGSPEMMNALPAYWIGLLYDDSALDAAEELVRRHPWRDYAALLEQVPRLGLRTPWANGTLRDLARETLDIAMAGLRARARHNAAGEDETLYLTPLLRIADGAPSQAEHWLNRYQSAWNGDVTQLLAEAVT